VLDDLVAEAPRGDLLPRTGSRASRSVRGTRGLSRRVGVAVQRRLELSSRPARAARGDHRGQRQVRVDVGARHAQLEPQRVAVADDAHRARAVVAAPGDRGGRERAAAKRL
jgi:hypothetical protein